MLRHLNLEYRKTPANAFGISHNYQVVSGELAH
jgi:hypothetical protein